MYAQVRIASVSLCAVVALHAAAAEAQLTVGNYTLVSSQRVSRTDFNYYYRADVTNTGQGVLTVTATAASSSPYTTVVDGSLSFGDVPAGSTAPSSDTFTIRQDRRHAFEPSALDWDVQYVNAALRITDVTPAAALPGKTVSLAVTGLLPDTPPLAVLAGQAIATTPVVGMPQTISFAIPAGAKSGPLYLEQGERSSNSVWFAVSEISVVTPAAGDIVRDASGNEVAANLVLVSMKEGFDSEDEAHRVAALVGAEVVGRIPLVRGYQLRLPTTNIDGLHVATELLKADPSIAYVLEDQTFGNFQVEGSCDPLNDWCTDPGLDQQRQSNRVKQGADLYVQEVQAGTIRPIFTSLGVLEDGIDYDAFDFANYGERGTARHNNVAIYASDIPFFSEYQKDKCDEDVENHGVTVTGIIASEIGTGNGHEDTGQNAGAIEGLRSHGGFNIKVAKDSHAQTGATFAHNILADTNAMLDEGASVVNWSFGIHRDGARNRNGDPLKPDTECKGGDHLRDAGFFDAAQEIFKLFFENMKTGYPRAVVVATAGNSDAEAVSGNRIFAIDSDSLIIVGAHDYGGDEVDIRKKWYSNFGSRLDIAAAGAVRGSSGKMREGTSFAAPLVTATIAAMQSINPDLSPKEIRTLLRKSSLPMFNEVKNDAGVLVGVFTAPLTEDEVDHPVAVGMGARLSVKGAVQAAIDSLGEKTVPQGDLIDVDLPFGSGNIERVVEVTVPSDKVFDKVDILFLVDVSGSYGDDIVQFRNQAISLVNAFSEAGANVEIGLASFSDFPISPYGSSASADYAYHLDQPLTTDSSTMIAAINALTIHSGADGPESQLEALYQAATGEGRTIDGFPFADIAPSDVGWRQGALPIIFLATDAGFHDSDDEPAYPGAGRGDVLAALTQKKIRVYGLQAGGSITDVESIVADTGGESFTLSSNSSEVVAAVEAALGSAASSVTIELVKNGDFADLVESICTREAVPVCEPPRYVNVTPGDTREFTVTFSRHLFERDPTADYVFALRLQVIAEDVAVILEIPVTVHVKFSPF